MSMIGLKVSFEDKAGNKYNYQFGTFYKVNYTIWKEILKNDLDIVRIKEDIHKLLAELITVEARYI